MGWVCPYCSNSNDEESARCAVCGQERHFEAHDCKSESETNEGKIVFSEFDIVKESVKRFFSSIAKLFCKKRDKKTDTPSERTPCDSKDGDETTIDSRGTVESIDIRETAPTEGDFTEPWDEHRIVFDTGFIKSKGFIRSEKTEMNSVKGYTFYKEDGTSQFIKVDTLVILRMAKRI